MEIIATDLVRSLVYLSLAEINLVFQIVILAVLSASVITLRKGRHHFLHGSTMLIATLLNALSFIWVMGPSLLNLGRLVVDKPYTMISTVTVAHGILGAIAGILAVWIIVPWRLRSSIRYCVGKRKTMKITLVLWMIALFSGILLYAFLYII